jgi:hypothetical protein
MTDLSRRSLLKKSIIGPAIGVLPASLEERTLLAQTAAPRNIPSDAAPRPADALPTGRIGSLKISRLIVGGNLISGFAHSRDLTYVSPLLTSYFTDEKVLETLQICEEAGINTAILRLDEHCLRIINKHWNERGGKIQWIAQTKIQPNDLSEITKAIDQGAVGVYVHGGVCDSLVDSNRLDLLAKAVGLIKENRVLAGIAGHKLTVPIACEKAGLQPDFYMKTLHSRDYWSANRQPENDNIWCANPDETIAFMKSVARPWIAYKVMAAGAIHPRDAFKYAFENGADFICAGMFDFQIREDVMIAKTLLSGKINRIRPWKE